MSRELKDEMENALRLLQIQNRSLRDRLKAAAEENERLQDQVSQQKLQQATQQHPEIDLLAENEKLKDDIARLTSAVHVMEEREINMTSSIEEWQCRLSKAEVESEEARKKIMALMEMVDSLKEQLREQIEEQEAAHTKDSDTEGSLKEQYAELELRFQEYEMKYRTEREKAREEIGWLRQGAEELQRQLDNAKTELEREVQRHQLLQVQLEEAKAANTEVAAVVSVDQQELQDFSGQVTELDTGCPSRASSPPGLISAPLVPHHRRDPSYSSEIEPIDGIKFPGDELTVRIKLLERELQDSENTHRLRDVATCCLKAEISELQRRQKRNLVDLDYLKAVLVESFASGELSDQGQHILPVLGELLQFSPQEMERASTGGGRKNQKGSTVTAAATAIMQAFST
jgi:chromosome segregation ATPase